MAVIGPKSLVTDLEERIMIHYVLDVLLLALGIGAGWYLKTKYGPKAGAIETKIDDYVKKL